MRALSPEATRNTVSRELLSQHSTLIEKTLERHLAGAISSELLLRRHTFDLLHGDCDRDGHDLVIEANGVTRHIQLKSQVLGGKATTINAHVGLTRRPSGCIVWMTWDPLTVRPIGWRFFGRAPGERIPLLGSKIASHSRGNKDGQKGLRPDHRIILASRFERVNSLEELVDRLFGSTRYDIGALLKHMAGQPDPGQPWLNAIRNGDFTAIPEPCDWNTSADLAHLIDGYALLADARCEDPAEHAEEALAVARQTGRWPGDARDLWISLFLEHRRWRHAEPTQPDEEHKDLLDTLVRQLRSALNS